MTTLVGLCTKDGIILGSDLQATNKEKKIKKLERKIQFSKNGNYVFADFGRNDEHSFELNNSMIDGDFNFEKMAEKESFRELLDIYLARTQGRESDQEEELGYLVGTVGEKSELYMVWPLGKVEPISMMLIGSGEKLVEPYLSSKRRAFEFEKNKEFPADLDFYDASQMLLKALDFASRNDLYSNGIDMVLIRKDKVIDFYGILSEPMYIEHYHDLVCKKFDSEK